MSEILIDPYCFCRAEMFQLDVFYLKTEFVVNKCRTCHHSDVFQNFFLDTCRPWHINSTGLNDVFLIVIDHSFTAQSLQTEERVTESANKDKHVAEMY